MNFSIKYFFSTCDQIHKLQIWSHLLKKSLMENFIFCAAICVLFYFVFHSYYKNEKRKTLIIYFCSLLCENEKLKTKFEIHLRYQLKIKKLVMSWISIFMVCVKNKNQGSILNFVFQFIKKTKWHFGYADFKSPFQVSEYCRSHSNHYLHFSAHSCETHSVYIFIPYFGTNLRFSI